MTNTSVSLAALLLMAACSATASPNVAAAPTSQDALEAVRATPPPRPSNPAAAPRSAMLGDGVSCDVRARPTPNGVLIQAVARSNRRFDGEYELVIAKSGGGGSSDVTQSGPVSIAAGQSVTLGSTELSAAGRFRAVLTLRDDAGEVCTQELRS